jgi:hypothetical protein
MNGGIRGRESMSDRESVINVTTVVGADGSIRVDRLPFQADKATPFL